MPLSPAKPLLIHFNRMIPHGVYPNCTLQVDCDLTSYVTAQISYYPSLTGNILYLGIIAILLLVHIGQGKRETVEKMDIFHCDGVWIGVDLFSLVLQAVGGGLSATANTVDEGWTGVHVMAVGLAFQVFSLVVFSGLCAELASRVHRSPNHQGREEKQQCNIHTFELGPAAATVLILVRSIYRYAELAEGFKGRLANGETPLMIFEGVMMILACLCLTILHPGWVLRGGCPRKLEGGRGGEGNELMGMVGKINGIPGGKSGYMNMDR
ncbi:RTA1 like protein-domain-containing protein [Amylocarpus encephaloides]|uniref:RTA1 like protein-domain-containing protein n=1 Tax=Amylocarpus encephaloides TaxID=45428 RepID=A0A9P8C607_9HELO|nr:RTA1 like protein-domain-containing protein [Amylocarpus encephaloides]